MFDSRIPDDTLRDFISLHALAYCDRDNPVTFVEVLLEFHFIARFSVLRPVPNLLHARVVLF